MVSPSILQHTPLTRPRCCCSCRRRGVSLVARAVQDSPAASSASLLPRRAALLLTTTAAALCLRPPPPALAASPSSDARRALATLLQRELRSVGPLSPGECLRLLFNDACSGGHDGSVRFELDRPESAGLRRTWEQLERAKAAVDAAARDAPELRGATASWTDVVGCAARTATKDSFDALLFSRAAPGKGATMVAAYGNPFPDALLGGVDAEQAGPCCGVPLNGSASDWLARFKSLGMNAADLAVLGPSVMGPDMAANEAVLMGDAGVAARLVRLKPVMNMLGRTSYEVPLGRAFDKLQRAGLTLRKEGAAAA